MAKYYGMIGFSNVHETTPGVYVEDDYIERPYYGELITFRQKIQNGTSINDDVNISNKISIIADAFANEHISNMRYAEFMHARWKITDIEVQYPRLILSLGGIHNA